MDDRVVVVGGGQAGLAVSHELAAAGVEHVVLERARIGQTWRGRWDSFCLVTPNWTIQLPGHQYTGDDPDGFLARDAIVAELEDYAASFQPPIQEGVEVSSVAAAAASRFRLRPAIGDLNFRTLKAIGVQLLGRLAGVEGGRAHFGADLAESVAFGDQRFLDFCKLIQKTCEAKGIPVPDFPSPEPFVADPPDSIPLAGL